MFTVQNVTSKAIQMVLKNGLKKYKVKNSKATIVSLVNEQKRDSEIKKKKDKKGSIFITRKKEHLSLSGSVGVVLASEEAVLDHIGHATHWTPNVFNYGTYVKGTKILKGHEEKNLQQINTFVVDIDTKENTPGEIVLAALDKGIGMPTFILESDKGYQAYFVLDKPVYVTNNRDYIAIKSAKRISENMRLALSEILTGVDKFCNHFGFFRMPNEENIVWFNEKNVFTFADLQDWSKDQDMGHRRTLFTVFSNVLDMTQVDQEWVSKLASCTTIKGSKGIIGRNNTVFTLALACYSSGKTEHETFDILDEYNSNLVYPIQNKEIRRVIQSAFSGKYKGANKEYIKALIENWTDGEITLPTTSLPKNWYKFKKDRKDRVQSHWYEWEQDIIDYLQSHKDAKKGFVYTTQKELCEALNIPRRTLNVVFNKSQRLFHGVVGKGSNRETKLTTLQMLFNYAMNFQNTKREAFISLIQALHPKAGQIVCNLISSSKTTKMVGLEAFIFKEDTG